MTTLIVAYLVLSLIASLLVYSSFVIAARGDRSITRSPRPPGKPLPKAAKRAEQ